MRGRRPANFRCGCEVAGIRFEGDTGPLDLLYRPCGQKDCEIEAVVYEVKGDLDLLVMRQRKEIEWRRQPSF